ncbi:aminotransferase class IV [Rathayibacter sp. VKM Ac-2856]|uniref:aminotransferase class IV n=1 Tax=unclassified Rathayibacter TaxID=2609250 RepID=UPI001564BD35|nr:MULTISPECIES: aminotransferase class IV [unclassified Rathayibacter]NQX03869.1 aminotransferase class IV [Rathayibacter sp. VKM Ac-2858]NQX19037.1 aminotransferase class IV [Rathayibacter sp. VKM Ac-2856]
MTSPVLVEIDDSGTPRLRDPEAGLVRVDEAGYLRGDGVFETLAVIRGRARGQEGHLARLAASADAVGLAIPSAEAWAAAIALAVSEHDAVEDLSIRLVAGHRDASIARSTVRAEPTADSSELRARGVAVAVLDRGYAHGATADAPWLLGGVKTTSGAVTRAALREARRRGAEDVVWRSSDGLLLEGATSSLVLLAEGALVTPSAGGGILDGTTVSRLLAIGEARGLKSARRDLPVAALGTAEAAWLVSSTRRAVPIRSVDGAPLAVDRELTRAFEAGLLAG